MKYMNSAPGVMSGFPGDLALQGEGAYQLLAEALANLDRQEVETNTGYERQRAEAGYGNQDAMRSIKNAMANRGTLKSGMTIRSMQNQGRNYTNILDQLANSRQSNLSSLAGQRLQAQGGYNQTMANLQSAFAGKSAEAISQAVQAETQRQLNAQQQQFNQQMMNQTMGTQQQMLNQMNKPAPSVDISSILQALGASNAPTPSQPNQATQPMQPATPLSGTTTKPAVKPSATLTPSSRILKPIGSQNRAV